uniref:Uncharacterized protein n=1 Tax=Globisporangium ultimum (strain ATCC 200006 / CBS 805.95 / DAOM BR144) TaxID=431595 RepID=K3XC64_GLOUD
MAAVRKANSTAKVFVAQVQTALRAATRPTPTLQGIDCSRLWVQGVIVSSTANGTECVVDDGTGVAVVDTRVFLKNTPPGTGKRPAVGDYIMVIGPLQKKRLQQTADTQPTDVNALLPPPLRILAHQVVQLDTKQQREPMWFLEVIEYWTAVVAQT